MHASLLPIFYPPFDFDYSAFFNIYPTKIFPHMIYACTDEAIIITPKIAIWLAIYEELNRLTQATWNLPYVVV